MDRPRYGPWQVPVQPAPADAALWAAFCATVELRIRDARLEDAPLQCPTCGTRTSRPETKTKHCPDCLRTLAVDCFGAHAGRHDGRQAICRDCQMNRQRAYRRRKKLAVVRDFRAAS